LSGVLGVGAVVALKMLVVALNPCTKRTAKRTVKESQEEKGGDERATGAGEGYGDL
jgi:hypothetical protein